MKTAYKRLNLVTLHFLIIKVDMLIFAFNSTHNFASNKKEK
jgi:hypothetical protein